MSDTSAANTTTGRAVADRQWIDASNNEVDDQALATGCRYKDLDSGRAFVYQTGLPPGQHATMLAIFGAMTKAGNIRNTLVNMKTDGGDVIEGIEAWFDLLITDGNWSADRVGGGMRFNAEVLARAIAHVKGEADHSPYLARITNRDKVKDPGDKSGKKEILYATFAYRNTAVKNQYHATLPADSAAPQASDL
jgi:hypothetical protein